MCIFTDGLFGAREEFQRKSDHQIVCVWTKRFDVMTWSVNVVRLMEVSIRSLGSRARKYKIFIPSAFLLWKSLEQKASASEKSYEKLHVVDVEVQQKREFGQVKTMLCLYLIPESHGLLQASDHAPFMSDDVSWLLGTRVMPFLGLFYLGLLFPQQTCALKRNMVFVQS